MLKQVNVKKKDSDGDAPLLRAIKNNSPDLAAFLLTQSGIDVNLPGEADVNTRNNRGDTPPDVAVKNTNLEMIRLLFKKVAYVNAKNNRGEMPLYVATENRHSK